MSAIRFRDYTVPKKNGETRSKSDESGFFAQLGRGVMLFFAGCIAVFLIGWWLQGQVGKIWPLTSPVTIVFTDPALGTQVGPWVAQLQPDTQTVVWQNLPAQKETELWSGYGTYKLASVQPLLTLDHRSAQYHKATFSLITGVMVETVVPWQNLPQWQAKLSAETVAKFGSEPFKEITKMHWQKIWSSNLSFAERKQNLIAWKQAQQWLWYTKQNRLRWNLAGEKSLLTPTASEHANTCPIAVVNATGIQGLAREIGAALSTDGYSVVRVSAQLEDSTTTQVLLDPSSGVECQKVAEQAVGILPLELKPQQTAEKTGIYRAPIVIIVGADSSR